MFSELLPDSSWPHPESGTLISPTIQGAGLPARLARGATRSSIGKLRSVLHCTRQNAAGIPPVEREAQMATKKPVKKVSVKDLKAGKGGSVKGGLQRTKWK